MKSSFLDIPHNIDNPAWQGGMRPNGPELFSPAEADRPTWVLRLGDGPGKLHSRLSPPGEHQRVVRRHVAWSVTMGRCPLRCDHAGGFLSRMLLKSALKLLELVRGVPVRGVELKGPNGT